MLQRAIIVCLALSVLSLPPTEAHTEEADTEIVVSGSLVARDRSKTASSVTVITEEEIQRSQKTQVLDLLETVPGLDVVRSGGPGGNTSIFMRGANSEHTLVILDGIELNNPGSNSRFYNFADLTLDNVERIEIIRGAQSTLYGSDAIGGVISIVTKRGEGAPQFSASAEAGSYQTFVEKSNLSVGTELMSFSLGASRQDIQGVSAANEQDGNSERDSYGNTSVSTRLGITAIDSADLNFFFRYSDANSDIDNTGGVGGDDPNREIDNDQLFFRTELDLEPVTEVWNAVLGFSYSEHQLEDNNDPDALSQDFLRSNFDGDLTKFDFKNTVVLHDDWILVAGFQTEEEKASSALFSDGAFGPFENQFGEEDARTDGYYSELLVDPVDWFSTSLGFRVDDHSTFGSEETYRIAPVVNLEDSGTRIKGSFGTGYKAPSLFQLFSSFGNPALQEEESIGFDVGVEQEFMDGDGLFGVTYFYNNIENLVTFNDETFLFENVEEADLQGIESFISLQLPQDLTVKADYTYTDTEDKGTGLRLLRRATNKFGVSLNGSALSDRLTGEIAYDFVGSRADSDFSTFPATRSRLGSYGLLGARVSYAMTSSFDIFARFENILDKSYQEVIGFGTLGAQAYGGVRFHL